MKALLTFGLILFLSLSCDDEKECPPGDRTGAVCNDGSTSTATGSGACSGHGGVKEWTCK